MIRARLLATVNGAAALAVATVAVQCAQAGRWPYAGAAVVVSLLLLDAALRAADEAAERRVSAVLAEAEARPPTYLADEVALGWAEFAGWCCLRGWQTGGKEHDSASCSLGRP